jgi:hypothetical protein
MVLGWFISYVCQEFPMSTEQEYPQYTPSERTDDKFT